MSHLLVGSVYYQTVTGLVLNCTCLLVLDWGTRGSFVHLLKSLNILNHQRSVCFRLYAHYHSVSRKQPLALGQTGGREGVFH